MVIDKWTRSQNNKMLSIPLLGHKSKETFSELKKEYERLQNLNHKFKKNSNSLLPKNINNNLQSNTEIIDYLGIKEYILELNSIIININELLLENNNNENDEEPISNDIKSIIDKIISEYNLFLNNINEINNKKCVKNNYDINSLFNESQIIINKISKKNQKEKKDHNIFIQDHRNNNNIFIQNQNSNININNNNNNNNIQNRNNVNRNIDRGHINIFTHRREFNDSITVVKNSFQYSIENEGLNNGIKLSLFFFILLFILFIFYLGFI